MAKYHLHLKGYVGAADFDSAKVQRCLTDNADSDIRVLIDSTGGQLATALTIAAAFRNHGAVDVHFVSLNASAATVASLGARTITMDRNAMYLVHKCSNTIFTWESMNADELEQYIARLTQNKEDLDKIDDNIAAMYATRCRKKPEELKALMKKGGWISAQEALEWGFIDKITDHADDDATLITDSLNHDLTAAGLPAIEITGDTTGKPRGLASIFTRFRDFMNAGRQSAPQAETSETHTTNAGSRDAVTGTATETTSVTGTAPETTATSAEQSETDTKVIDTAARNTGTATFQTLVNTGRTARDLYNSIP